MKKTLPYLLFFLSFCFYGQTSIQWQKSIGGKETDSGNTIIKTSDGGYITTTSTTSTDGDMSDNHGSYDILVIKFKNNGTVEWQKCYGGSNYDGASSIIQTKDGGYIIAGQTGSTDGDVIGNHNSNSRDMWILKIASNGKIEWQKCLGGSNYDQANGIIEISDGYIIGGSTSSTNGDVKNHTNSLSSSYDYWVLKINKTGDIIWEKCYGGSDDEVLNSIKLTSDSGFILNGSSRSKNGNVTKNEGEQDYWIVKLNSIGEIEWQKSFGGKDMDLGTDAIQTSTGDYIVTGYAGSGNSGDITDSKGNGDAWVIKLNSSGNLIWKKSFGGSGGDFLYTVIETIDGGYALAGDTTSNDGDVTGNHSEYFLDAWVIKLSTNGNIEWSKSFGGSQDDTATTILEIGNENFLFIGRSSSNDGDVTNNYGREDIWLVNIGNNLTVPKNTINKNFSFYPNPTKDFINLKIDSAVVDSSYQLYDSSSKLIKYGKLDSENSTIQISDIPNGIYFLKVFDSSFKIIKN